MNLLPQLFNGMVVIGSLSMVGDVSVVSDVFDQLFLNYSRTPFIPKPKHLVGVDRSW